MVGRLSIFGVLFTAIAALVQDAANKEAPPANVKAYIDKISLTPAAAKKERAAEIQALQADIKSLSLDLADAKRFKDQPRALEIGTKIGEKRKAIAALNKKSLPKVSAKRIVLPAEPVDGDIGYADADAELRVASISGEKMRLDVTHTIAHPRIDLTVAPTFERKRATWIIEGAETKDIETGKGLSPARLPLLECIGVKGDDGDRVKHFRPIDVSKWLPK